MCVIVNFEEATLKSAKEEALFAAERALELKGFELLRQRADQKTVDEFRSEFAKVAVELEKIRSDRAEVDLWCDSEVESGLDYAGHLLECKTLREAFFLVTNVLASEEEGNVRVFCEEQIPALSRKERMLRFAGRNEEADEVVLALQRCIVGHYLTSRVPLKKLL